MIALQTDIVGPYELLRLLGHGGFCAVYEARDRTTGEHVALKQLRRMGPVSLANFKREFRAVQGVYHPNLVELRELFEYRGACFIAMEFVEGCDLITYLRDGQAAHDDENVRAVFVQLSQALMALHVAGVLHRDLKPRNVLVTPAGRVVLLDFGLVKTLGTHDEAQDFGVGSAAYMAPEQAAGTAIGPAADFYALGVCLYEALTGKTPFASHSPFGLMQIKQTQVPPAPTVTVPELSRDLAALCMRLLEIEPSRRPSASEVVRTFEADAQAPLPAAHLAPVERFSGREPELLALAEGFAASRAGEVVLLLVEGESGIGKGALVAEFLRRLQLQQPTALLLPSRCYENELLAYKAFDGGMEHLARELLLLDDVACQALLPPHAVLLPRLFAALGTVRAIADAKGRAIPADPAAQRLTAFAALCALLEALGRQRPLVLSVEDLQWADGESFSLLRALLEAPHRGGLLVVATLRPSPERADSAAAAIALLQSSSHTRRVALGGLSRPDARKLASELLGPRASHAMLDTLVNESRGHPLFLVEIARYAGSTAFTQDHITLDDAFRSRIEALAPAAEQLISAVALAGRPYHPEVFAKVLQVPLADFRVIATELLACRLLRRGRGQELECFHDRIARVAVGRLGPQRRHALHERLADGLAQHPGADPAELASHCEAAGRVSEAVDAYGRAADQALATLAFARAEQLFARALSLAEQTNIAPHAVCTLRIGRGHALARSGFSAQAAAEYLTAAASAEGERKIQLRIWAAQHLLQSCRVEEGMSAGRALLEELGVPMPSGPVTAIARLLWDRAYLGVRGLEAAQQQSPMSVEARMQLDALWGLALPMAWVDPLLSAALGTRYLRLARALGEPTHLARALAEEAFARTVENPTNTETNKLLARARGLLRAAGANDPALEVNVSFREANTAYFRWDLRLARERLEHALQVGTEACPDEPWLLTNVRTNLAAVLVDMGEHARVAASCTAWLAEARDRNDQFALTMLEAPGSGWLRHLMADAPDQARSSLAAVLSLWPRAPFSYAHLGELISVTNTELYRGGAGTRDWLAGESPRLSRALMLKVGISKGVLLVFRACASLAAMAAANSGERARLASEVRAHTRAIRAIASSYATVNALSLEGQLLALDGKVEAALIKTRQVHVETDTRGYALLHHPNAYLEGLLEGGDAGRGKQAAALGFFAEQGWKKPRRAVAMLCPAIDQLEAG